MNFSTDDDDDDGPGRPAPQFLLGLDLGQSADYSALAIAKLTRETHESPGVLDIVHLHRWMLGTPYPAIVNEVVGICARPEVHTPSRYRDATIWPVLLVDMTGVGRPVCDLFVRARPKAKVCPVTITGGHDVRFDAGCAYVPKKDLVSGVTSTLQSGRLRVVPTLEHAPTLRAELLNFRVTITPSANESFAAWREQDHDDLVLAVAMVAWHAERFMPVKVRVFT